VLIETMRREGFELMVSPPRVLERVVDGERLEPFEEVGIEITMFLVSRRLLLRTAGTFHRWTSSCPRSTRAR
jgi:predicted membrane GTPase involved in stress response